MILTDGQGQVEVEQLSGLSSGGQSHDDVGHCSKAQEEACQHSEDSSQWPG